MNRTIFFCLVSVLMTVEISVSATMPTTRASATQVDALKSYLSAIMADDRSGFASCFDSKSDQDTQLVQSFADLVFDYRQLRAEMIKQYGASDGGLPYLLKPFSDNAIKEIMKTVDNADVAISGDTATVSAGPDNTLQFVLVRIGNEWKMSTYGVFHLSNHSSVDKVAQSIKENARYADAATQTTREIKSGMYDSLEKASIRFQQLTMAIVTSEIPSTQPTMKTDEPSTTPASN